MKLGTFCKNSNQARDVQMRTHPRTRQWIRYYSQSAKWKPVVIMFQCITSYQTKPRCMKISYITPWRAVTKLRSNYCIWQNQN